MDRQEHNHNLYLLDVIQTAEMQWSLISWPNTQKAIRVGDYYATFLKRNWSLLGTLGQRHTSAGYGAFVVRGEWHPPQLLML